MKQRVISGANALFLLAVLFVSPAFAQTTPNKDDSRIHELLDKALAAHGGVALTKLQTFTEVLELQASGMLIMRAPTQRCEVWLDRSAASGRWQISVGGKMKGVYQQTPAGVYIWTSKNGSQKVREADTPFSFLPLLKTGVLGLLALSETKDTLTFVANGEIKGKKGPMIVRTQAAAQETLLLVGGGITRESCQTTWSYLFATDGTLIAERILQTQPKRILEMQMSYDRFQMFGGIKVPTEISVKSNQVPRGFSLRMKVKQVTVNAPTAAASFQMP